ncbi:auxin-responsive protein SAUR36-like [Panicum miliaceum]|uniref:Auxin-responsive protein SAUR36-like n=1 Tax=Panicum miliaceum TaxID=4540 RepID=A0A3L6Q510_PANMI|nr:auxin-responsive protein SAUR36-like [Panicum miliaceum]
MLRRSHGGFRLGRKLLGLWRWALCGRGRRRGGYIRLQQRGGVGGCCGERATRKKLVPVLRWGRSLARRLSLGWRAGGHRALDDGGGEPAGLSS